MKTKMLLLGTTILMIVTTTIFTGCKKYPEGPSLTLRTAKGRITNMWHLKKEIVFHYGNTDIYPGEPNQTIDIKTDKTYVSNLGNSSESGKWAFSSDKESVTLTVDNGDASTFKILELTKREMIIKYEDGKDVYYEFHFEK